MRHDTNAFRVVYTIEFDGAVYVLHAFQKKSKRGIATPRQHVALIRARYELAKRHYEQWTRER